MEKRFNSVKGYMTSLIDRVNEINKDDPVRQYVCERIEVCDTLCQAGLLDRALIEIEHILINLEKRLNI